MKKLNWLLVFLFLISFNAQSFSKDIYDFSENKKIYLERIRLMGNQKITDEEIFEIIKLKGKKGFFIYEIEEGIGNLISSGFFEESSYHLEEIKDQSDTYELRITVKENPPLASLKVIDDKMLDLSVFKEKIRKNKILIMKSFSRNALEKAIDEFNIYNQSYGTFLYTVSFKEIKKEEIKQEGGTILFEANELERDGVHVLIYIREIPRLQLKRIRMMNTTVSYDEIMSFLKLKQNMWIENDENLFFRYKRLKRLGFYDTIYFKLIPDNPKELSYTLIIITQEVPMFAFTTTLTAPANIGLITAVEYYNISLFNSLSRFRVGAGWELNLSSPTFVLEYTEPYLWSGVFLDATFLKSDTLDIIKDQSNRKLTNNYDLKLTLGLNLFSNVFGYVFHKERYSIASTVNQDNERLGVYDKVKTVFHSSGFFFIYDSLNDNFFISQGVKISLEYETYWKQNMAHKVGIAGEIYVPVPIFNLISAASSRSYILFTDKKDKETSLSLDAKMRTNVQEITDINNQQIKFTNFSSIELRFPLPEIKKIVKDLSFIIFAEAGGAWADYSLLKIEEVKYGFGIGFRLSPRQHYSSFLFQFPAGLYLGYRTGDSKTKTTLTSHRDDFYYINLTASF